MRRVIFIVILSTLFLSVQAQGDTLKMPVRLIVTAHFQRHLFGRDPLWGGWPDGSLSRALSYVNAWRREMGDNRVVLINVGAEVEDPYALYPDDVPARVSARAGYADSTALLPAADLAWIAAGLDARGRTIGVVDFTAPGEYEVKAVDISGFPVDAPFEEHFADLTDSIRMYCDTPIARLRAPAPQADYLIGPTAYTGLFHRFQLEATGADVSFFAVPRIEEEIPAGEMTFGDVLRRFRYANGLAVVELTGKEILQYLEYAYSLRYNTMRKSTDDLVRTTRDRDGLLAPRSAPYNLDEAAGIRYEVDVTRPAGRRIRVIGEFDPEKTYRAAVNSHRLGETGLLTRALGRTIEPVWTAGSDYRLLLKAWLEKQGEIVPENLRNWQPVPEGFISK